MKAIAILMILVGLAIGAGGVIEILAYPPSEMEFWVGIAAILASGFSIAGGIILWLRRDGAPRVAFLAAAMMVAVTAAATSVRVMGVLAAIIGIAGPLVVMGWVVAQGSGRRHQSL